MQLKNTIYKKSKCCHVAYVEQLGRQTHIILNKGSNTYAYHFAKTVTKAATMAFMAAEQCGM